MLKYPEVKRAWIVGDIHLGIRAASMDWFDISKIYFEQYLLPLIEKNYKEGDVLIQLGDLFENRQTINLKFNSYAIEILQRIGKILPVFIICGNHDIYYKKTNEVTSLDSIKYIPNIYLFKQPEMIKFGKTDCLMMPWRADYKEEGETLDQFPNAEFVFCHSEMQGVMLNRKSVQHEGTKVSKFKNYRRVYSGHIHYSQTVKNVVMVGNAYQMTRSDHNNPKGTYLLDFKTGEHTFYENKVTPEFVKLNVMSLLELPLEQFKDKIRNNFVDLYIPSDIMIKYNMSHLINLVQDVARKIEPNIYDEKTFIDIDTVTEEIQNGYKNFDVLNLCSKWVDNSPHDSDIKNKMKERLKQLYTISTSHYNPDL